MVVSGHINLAHDISIVDEGLRSHLPRLDGGDSVTYVTYYLVKCNTVEVEWPSDFWRYMIHDVKRRDGNGV